MSLADLPKNSARQLLGRCRLRLVQAGEALFSQDTPHVTSYIVQDGLVRTYYTASSGREVALGYWAEGELVGGPNFLGGGHHVWSGAMVHAGRVLAIRNKDLAELTKQDPEILRWVADTLSSKLRWLSILFQIHATESVRQRVARLLILLSDIYGQPSGNEVVIRHHITQGQLASLAGASRQWTNRTLGDLRRDGLLAIDGRQIRILDRARLEQISAEGARFELPEVIL